ncbi:MAG: DUF455 family protein [Oligoflexus sp.]
MELSEFAEIVLFSARLEDKLLLIQPDDFIDAHPHRSFVEPAVPGRPKALDFAGGNQKSTKFPNFAEMKQDTGRGRVLHFFANHELLALELMALALLKFPDAPPSFRMNIGRTMLEEQHHLRLYLSRMAELGIGFGDIPVNDFFWQCLKSMRSPLDYVTGMSLTFEQANLDYSYHYWRLMQQLGDSVTADILQQVLQDEIGHVKFGVSWFDRWRDPQLEIFAAHEQILRSPLSMSRAKGIGFREDVRLKAGLPKTYIDQLEVYGGSKGRPADIYFYNPDCEIELAHHGRGYTLAANKQTVIAEQMPLMMFLAKEGDLVLCDRQPSPQFLKIWKNLGFPIPEFVEFHATDQDYQSLSERPRFGAFIPWGWTRRTLKMHQRLFANVRKSPELAFLDSDDFDSSPLRNFFRKDRLPQLRRRLRAEIPHDEEYFGPSYIDGQRVCQLTELEAALTVIWQNDKKEPAVVKPPFGSAGQNMRRLFSPQDWQSNVIGWLNHQLDLHDALLVEPWFDKIADFSVVWGIDGLRDETLTLFHTDAKGCYLGHSLGAWQGSVPADIRRELFEQRHGKNLIDMMLELATIIRQDLADIAYTGPAGIDLPVFRDRHSGRIFVKCVGEINPRLTMGHIAMSMERRLRAIGAIKAKQAAYWRLLQRNELQRAGLHQPSVLLNWLRDSQRDLPTGEKLLLTSDPQPEIHACSILAIGSTAMDILLAKLS